MLNPQSTSKKMDFVLLGTDNWESYSLYQAGMTLWEADEWDEAYKLYRRALSVDPKNRGALVNLGIVETRRASPELALFDKLGQDDKEKLLEEKTKGYRRARKWLRRAIKELTKQEESIRAQNQLDLLFDTLALKDIEHEKDLSLQEKDPSWYVAQYQLAALLMYEEREKQALERARCLYDRINNVERKIHEIRAEKNLHGVVKNLDDFFETFKPRAILLYVGVLTANAKSIEDVELKRAFEELKESEASPYNLACYYAAIGENDKALKLLEFALIRGGSAKWAARDPSFQTLCESDSKRFQKIVQQQPPSQGSNDAKPKTEPIPKPIQPAFQEFINIMIS